MASKKGAMRALGRVVRNDEAANEVVAAGGLVPIITLLYCSDAGVVRRYHLLCRTSAFILCSSIDKCSLLCVPVHDSTVCVLQQVVLLYCHTLPASCVASESCMES